MIAGMRSWWWRPVLGGWQRRSGDPRLTMAGLWIFFFVFVVETLF